MHSRPRGIPLNANRNDFRNDTWRRCPERVRSVDPGAPRGAPPVDPERANPHEDDYRLIREYRASPSVEIDAFQAPDCRVTHV